ncbi:MAG: protein kinase [Phycisphaeraceae bacterium]|nr:protein kinase [Phycisphaeraceae bacterium]MCW5763143.1 protein kinase [Phycisphaeraceae bacterium]
MSQDSNEFDFEATAPELSSMEPSADAQRPEEIAREISEIGQPLAQSNQFDEGTTAPTSEFLKQASFGDLPRAGPPCIDGLETLHELGRGATGTVWLARDILLKRLVAVKVLHPKYTTESAQLLAGAAQAALVAHPNLTQVLHAGRGDLGTYLVQEYARGEALTSVLQRRGALSPSEAVRIVEAVAHAAGALHDAGMVHRDIKPGNVVLEADGSVKLTDFGLLVNQSLTSAVLDGRNISGTPAYMAPEMFDGAASARTDVYAMGIMLYELLTGEKPFLGSISSLADMHRSQPIPIDRLKDLPAELVEVVARATDKRVIFRYKSGQHLAKALSDLQLISGAVERVRAGLDSAESAIANLNNKSQATTSWLIDAKKTKLMDNALIPCSPLTLADSPNGPSNCADDIPCVGCGFSVKGLPMASDCPECGKEVRATVEYPSTFHLLYFGEPFLGALERGLQSLRTAFGCWLAITVVAFAVLIGIIGLSLVIFIFGMVAIALPCIAIRASIQISRLERLTNYLQSAASVRSARTIGRFQLGFAIISAASLLLMIVDLYAIATVAMISYAALTLLIAVELIVITPLLSEISNRTGTPRLRELTLLAASIMWMLLGLYILGWSILIGLGRIENFLISVLMFAISIGPCIIGIWLTTHTINAVKSARNSLLHWSSGQDVKQ